MIFMNFIGKRIHGLGINIAHGYMKIGWPCFASTKRPCAAMLQFSPIQLLTKGVGVIFRSCSYTARPIFIGLVIGTSAIEVLNTYKFFS